MELSSVSKALCVCGVLICDRFEKKKVRASWEVFEG